MLDLHDQRWKKIKAAAFFFVVHLELLTTLHVWGTTLYNRIIEEETVAAFVYKMDKPWLRPDEFREEIRWGHALWMKLRRNHKMRVSEAVASMSTDGVLTFAIPQGRLPSMSEGERQEAIIVSEAERREAIRA
ncbi:hypothetical protein ACJRO7_024340 [Eucalyptus globulus]|uniref:Uncharacterized protein n=1 Tax=Eucalyptus globulus TaxID=34317 RepID=A0ABD3KB06_EUCGL